MKVGNQGKLKQRRRRHDQGMLSSFVDTVGRKLSGFANVAKKDDDFGYKMNDPEARRRGKRDIPWMYRVASWNPIVLIVALSVVLIVFTIVLMWILAAIFGGGTVSENDIGRGSSKSRAFKDLVDSKKSDVVDKAINDLLSQMDAAKDDIDVLMMSDWEHQFSTMMNTHCLKELPFKMEFEALQTFEAHIAYLFTSLQSKDMVHYLDPETTEVTEDGTVVDRAVVARSPRKHAPCSLITGLLRKAQSLQIMVENVNDDNEVDEDEYFSMTNEAVWRKVKDRFDGKNVDETVYELITMVKDTGADLHVAKQILPKLMNTWCPHVFAWYDEKEGTPHSQEYLDNLKKWGEDDPENWIDPRQEAVLSVEDLLRQLHHHGNIHLKVNEVPALDRRGYMVAVDQFVIQSATYKFSDNWVSCNFIDKVAYYHNRDIREQSAVLVEQAREHNYFAFDNQADILMLEHCAQTVAVLSAGSGSKKRNRRRNQHFDRDDIYLNVFRGELLSFAGQVANDHFVGDAQSFVVTNAGGIMHRDEAERGGGGFTECELIRQMAAVSRGSGDGEGRFDENQFNPEHHGKAFDELEKELHAEKSNMDDIAQSVVAHALRDDAYGLRRLTTNALYQFHGDQIRELGRDTVEHLLSEINQYVLALINIETNVWPPDHLTIIDLNEGKLTIMNKDDVGKDPKLVSSEVFNRIFKAAIEAGDGGDDRKKNDDRKPRSDRRDERKDERRSGRRENRKDERKDERRDDNRGRAQRENVQKGDEYEQQRLRSYVSILLRDIKKQEGPLSDGLLRDIDADMLRYCRNMVDELTKEGNSPYRVFVSDLLSSIRERRDMVRDPVVTADGHIVSRDSVDNHRDLWYECSFVTELLVQSG